MKPVKLLVGDIVKLIDLSYSELHSGCEAPDTIYLEECRVVLINQSYVSKTTEQLFGEKVILDLIVFVKSISNYVRISSQFVEFVERKGELPLSNRDIRNTVETQTGRMESGDKGVMQGVAYPIYASSIAKTHNLDPFKIFKRGSTLILDTEATKSNFWVHNMWSFKDSHPYNNAQINTNQPNNTDMKKETKTTSIDVEALLKEAETNGMNSMLKEALTEEKRRSDEDKKRKLIEYIQSIKSTTAGAVEHLRDARRQERLAKTHLQEIAAAEQEFYKDVDYVKYNGAVNAATEKYYSQKIIKNRER